MKNEIVKADVFVGILLGTVLFVFAKTASAQDAPYECDDQFGECGTPQQSGGGCGCGGGGSILVNNTDLGITYQYADDYDDDGKEDPYDNCPFVSNRDQADDDGDGIGTACDNCPNTVNEDQSDIDGDLMGDVCDDDIDGDNTLNEDDLCPLNPEAVQKDTDKDGIGDACDPDMDNDGVDNLADNCPLVPNPDQAADDPTSFGDACDADEDGDGVREAGLGNIGDNCPSVFNPDQEDADGDGLGDLCDPDIDEDGYVNKTDNCPLNVNPDQQDLDRDSLGDECDPKYCYVFEDDVENCINPEDAFKVYSLSKTDAETGEEIQLHLFANRVNEPIRYTWRIESAPDGSSVGVENPVGAVNVSTPYEYHYMLDQVAMLVPDMPGEYKIRLQAELVWEDSVTGAENAQAEAETIVTVSGSPMNDGNCSVVAVGDTSSSRRALIPILLLAFGLLLARRQS